MQRFDASGWVEWLTHTFLACVAVLIFSAFVALAVASLFLIARPARADDSFRVPAICMPLAQRYGVPEIVSREQAIEVVAKLERYSWWPGVRQCRRAVKIAWKM